MTYPKHPKNCKHTNPVPYVYEAGRRTMQEKTCEIYYDWTSNIINANRIRVLKYFCPECGLILRAPSDAADN